MFHISHPIKKASSPIKILNVIKNNDNEQTKNQINNTNQIPLNITNNEFIKNIKKTHEEGNCICFILTLIFYLINSKGKKYPISSNITSVKPPPSTI